MKMAVFFNQATLTYNDITVNSNIVSGEIVGALALTKTAVNESYEEGERITYVLSLTNTGATDYANLTVTDNLGAYTFGTEELVPLNFIEGTLLYYVNGSQQPAPAVSTANPLVITGVDVPANGNALLIYQAQANEFAPLEAGSNITNEASVTGGSLADAVTDTETVPASAGARLNITKSLTPTVVTDNSEITYTFTIENFGNEAVVATDDAVITDNFDPILSNVSVTLNGVPLATPAGYTYNTATGAFATVPGIITVPAATYMQDPVTGQWSVTPGTVVLEVTGTV